VLPNRSPGYSQDAVRMPAVAPEGDSGEKGKNTATESDKTYPG